MNNSVKKLTLLTLLTISLLALGNGACGGGEDNNGPINVSGVYECQGNCQAPCQFPNTIQVVQNGNQFTVCDQTDFCYTEVLNNDGGFHAVDNSRNCNGHFSNRELTVDCFINGNQCQEIVYTY